MFSSKRLNAKLIEMQLAATVSVIIDLFHAAMVKVSLKAFYEPLQE